MSLKIAVFRALQLGDMLCVLPALACIKRNFPNAQVTVIGLQHMEPLVRRYRFVDDFIVFPGYPGLPELPTPSIEQVELFVQDMCDRNFDLLFQLHGNGTLVNDFLRKWESKRLVGYCPDGLSVGSDWMLYPDGMHEIERHLKLLAYVGLTVLPGDSDMQFPLDQVDRLGFAQSAYGQLGTYIIVHVGSRNAARQWPLANFKCLADYVQDKGFTVVLTGSQAEVELVKHMQRMMESDGRPVLNLAGQTDLGQLGCLVEQAALLICNCTGISHVAAALKTKSIVISLDGEPERWGPINKKLHYTYNGLEGAQINAIKKGIDQLLDTSV